VLLFDDDSRMKIRTAVTVTLSPGGKVKSVQEDRTELKIEFEDSSSATFRLDDPGSSVAVRDRNNVMEYLGLAIPNSFGLPRSNLSQFALQISL